MISRRAALVGAGAVLAVPKQAKAEYVPGRALRDYWEQHAKSFYGLRQGLGPTWAVLFAGDSRAMAPYRQLGGAPCFSAAFLGATIKDLTPHLFATAQNFSPRVLIIQAGANYAWVPRTDPQWATLRQDADYLINTVRSWTPHVVMTTPVPFEKAGWSPARPDADIILRSSWVAEVAQTVRMSASAMGVNLVDLHAEFVTADGTAKPGTTYDGVHFTAATYDRIKQLLDPVVERLFPI